MKTIVSAFAAGLVAASFAAAPAKAGPNSCPAFTTAIVDATAVAAGLFGVALSDPNSVGDDPTTGVLRCYLQTDEGFFGVDISGNAELLATNAANVFGSKSIDVLTPGQRHACRAAVVQSFVWTTHCAPHLP